MTDEALTKQLSELCVDQKAFNAKVSKNFMDLQKQVDFLDLAHRQGPGFVGDHDAGSGPGQQFTDSPEFKAAVAAQFSGSNKKITATIANPFAGRKSIITTTSGITAGVTGVTMPMRLPGITGIAQQGLRIRDLM